MWFIGVEVEQETSAPLPKKILDPRLKSPEMLTVCGSKVYHPQQYPSIPITICSACFF